MIARRHRRRKQIEGAELELTAFINPMVVLVTFLLMNVVFSHSAVLELRLPGPGGGTPVAPAEKMNLEITVRKDSIQIGDRNRGLIAAIPNGASGPDLAQLSTELQQIKSQHPDEKAATILLEPDTSYDRIVQVMDAIRSMQGQAGGRRFIAELFPEIAIGDAPVADGK
jgi:biopolymer transport protein ExbD